MTATPSVPPETIELFDRLKKHLKMVNNILFEVTKGITQDGPFMGQQLLRHASWGAGDLSCKLLGCYEAELHTALEVAIRKNPEISVNVGCAEGYYAIGLALRLPCTRHYAYDIDPAARAVCQQAAEANGVDDLLTIGGECHKETLIELFKNRTSGLLVLDCEGAEADLLTPDVVPSLAASDIIIECHDHLVPGVSQTLMDRLSATHTCRLVREGARDPSGSPLLQPLPTFERWLAVCEFRPCLMHWLIATPKP